MNQTPNPLLNRSVFGILTVTVCATVASGCGGEARPPPNLSGDLGRAGRPSAAFAISVESPISLTASDGTGLTLSALEAKAVIDGPLAFTELHLAFDNPIDRTVEGTFRIALPQNASLGRFAMKLSTGEWQEGEVVELEAARRAYEDFLHRKQDPALMEKAAGNEFSARVFPIPARGKKEIIVSFVSEIKKDRYVLPLKGLPELGSLDVSVNVLGSPSGAPPAAPSGRVSKKNVVPSEDYVLPVPPASSVRSGEFAILRVRPQTTSKPEPMTNGVVVLVDTSASRALGFDKEIDLVAKIIRRIAEGSATALVTVACFDQTVAPIFEGKASVFVQQEQQEIAKIHERGALGASNLESALTWSASRGAKTTTRANRLVIVGDGVVTAGATEPKKLLPARIAALKEAGIERIDAVAIGGIRDDEMLTRLVRSNGLAHDGVVADASDAADVLRRLGEATRSNIAVKVEGSTWSWPQKIDGAQSGDSFSIYVEMPAADKQQQQQQDKPLKIAIDGGASVAEPPRKGERALIERAVAQAKVAAMIERALSSSSPSSGKESLKKNIVAMATRHRIMTPYTAMLVLETEADYLQYGIDRKSLSDVLAIQDAGVQRIHRESWATLPARPPPSPSTRDDGYGYEFTDDPLSAGGFGPSDATIRVRPGPVATNPSPSLSSAKPSAPAARPPSLSDALVGPPAAPEPPPMRQHSMLSATASEREESEGEGEGDARQRGKPPLEGKLAFVMQMIKAKRLEQALESAREWHAEAPGDVLALVAIGEAAEAMEKTELAARAYGSIIDLFSNRADLRRFAGERLERLTVSVSGASTTSLDLAIDTFEKALLDRPDHPSSHRLLTFALIRKKAFSRAFEVAALAAQRRFDTSRFAGVTRTLREDVGLAGAAWARAEPARREEILKRIREAGGYVEDQPSLRFVLNWETDANDVDFHIHDAKGGHAFFSRSHLKSGGDLYADVTTGYGPECFTIRGAGANRAGPYKLEAHYYARGPMGYGMGKLEVIDHDGNGNISFDERPFVVMVDQAFVDLGTVK